jgi:hypothetical protein
MERSAVIWGVLAFSLARLAIDAAALWPLGARAAQAAATPLQQLAPWLIGAPLIAAPLAMIAAAACAPRLLVRAVAAGKATA